TQPVVVSERSLSVWEEPSRADDPGWRTIVDAAGDDAVVVFRDAGSLDGRNRILVGVDGETALLVTFQRP
ncbi:MAG: hypothetical protein LC679_19220, partial [Intrasporangiaceae bacterium]|nr:hypothetical protein [Intrasporangiaceae bacterium]